MNVRQLSQIIKVAQAGNISTAAEALNISQPPLTRMIRKVEEELGHDIFLRTSRGIELTEAGRSFVQDAAHVIDMHDRMIENARRIGSGLMGEFSIGIYGSSAYHFVPGVFRRFMEEYPGVKINLLAMDGAELLVALRNHKVAIGFNPLSESAPDVVVRRISGERLLIALPERHPLTKHADIAPAEIVDTPLILMTGPERVNYLHLATEAFRSVGRLPRVTHEVSEPLACLSLVSSGFGFALVSESSRTLPFKGVAYRDFRMEDPPSVDLACAYLRESSDLMLKAFLKAIDKTEAAVKAK
ncbi:LysR family transcriptional regulator [Novosphingobium aquimarinum]|uniref:LysR family transcriptional regulator n=1 Tax=Novosphingobium aquimarinum TaxID=2682494 RepID=UPI0012EC321B|nr:LysR family transcriptional regulator [Novosphingobium aquimarinum]